MNNKNVVEFSDGVQKYQKQISIVMTVEVSYYGKKTVKIMFTKASSTFLSYN